MHSLIAEKAKQARDRSAMFGRAIGGGSAGGGGGGGMGANPLGLGVGGSNFGYGNKRTDLTQHTEQYRHNTGWVAASIKPIASRIARQPVRMARVARADPRKMSGPHGTKGERKSGAGSVSFVKPWEKGSAESTASAVWFKQHLPGVYKQLAANAELIDAHPILDAIDDPNPIMVRWSLMFVTVASLLLTGKAYWWVKARERDGEPDGTPRIEIWPLPSSWVKPVHSETRLYASWEVTPEGTHEAFPVPTEQVIYFYLPDPSSLLGSQSPLQNQARAVVSDEAISEAQRRGFANGVFPGVAVVVGRQPGINGAPGDRPTLNREQRSQILTAFKQAYRGVYNHDEPIILDQLIQDVKRVTNTNREMDFQASGDYTKERITQGFGVNPISMGQVEGANRASSATADDHLCQNTVNPIIELISQTLTAWLNPLLAGPDERLVLFIEEARAVDPDSDREDWLALWEASACSKDELRAGLRALPPMVNGSVTYADGSKIEVDARLASEVATANPSRPLMGPAPAPAAAPSPAQNSEPAPATPKPAAGGDVHQDTAAVPDAGAASLNGAQIASLLEVLDKLGTGQYPADAVEAILAASFPTLAIDVIRRLIEAIERGAKITPEESGDGASGAASGGASGAAKPAAVMAPRGMRWTRSAEFIGQVIAVLRGKNPADTMSEVEIAVDDIRQHEPFDCGAAVGYAAALALGCNPGSYADFMVRLDTTPEVGTDPQDLFSYFAHEGCEPKANPNRTVEHLRTEIRRGRLCLCPVQYFGDGDAAGGEGGAGYDSGHWVLVYGFTRDSLKVLDPFDGKVVVSNNAFLGNWYDRGQDGKPFVRYAISAGRKPTGIVDPSTNTGNSKPSRQAAAV